VVYSLLVVSRKALVRVIVPAATLYVLLWIAVAGNWAWLDGADNWMLRQFHRVGAHQAGWIGFWEAVSDVLSPTALRVVALGVIIAALIRRSTWTVVFLLLTVGGMGLVTVAAKALVGRPRPDAALILESSSAFPSGHALGATVAVLAFITLARPHLHRATRTPVAVVGVATVALVGLARVALNVHHPSDVVAGWALGLLYFLLCMAVLHRWVPRPSAQRQDPDLVSVD
jgi:membrane-associated phospholipid phosphatase